MALRTPVRTLTVSAQELDVSRTCRSGQSFRWSSRAVEGGQEWFTALSDRTVALRQTGDTIRYEALYPSTPAGASAHAADVKDDTTVAWLRRYFALDIDLGALCRGWASEDPHFAAKTASGHFGGIRILRQPAFEATVSFICSSNNHISRIGLMIGRLCAKYGTAMPSPDPAVQLYAFPKASALAGEDVEEELRELGFGYRARYVANTCALIAAGDCPGQADDAVYNDDAPLDHLRDLPFADARQALLTCSGVGPKVADCIALFGLGHDAVVPIDTHVWRIATRDYGFRAPAVKGKGKAKAKAPVDGPISKDVYVQVQAFLAKAWGPFAGWKQQILFTADLRSFADKESAEVPVELPTGAIAPASVVLPPTPAATPKKRTRKVESPAFETPIKRVKSDPYPSPALSESDASVVDSPSAPLADRVKGRRARRTAA